MAWCAAYDEMQAFPSSRSATGRLWWPARIDSQSEIIESMARPYDDIPRQGEHPSPPLDSEPTTSVRAQQPVEPPNRTKATSHFYVLSTRSDQGLYRLDRVSADSRGVPEEGYDEVARIPVGGDLGGLFERLPEGARHTVYENTGSGTRTYDADRRLSHNWTDEGAFDRVTIFSDHSEAEEYARAVKDDSAAK